MRFLRHGLFLILARLISSMMLGYSGSDVFRDYVNEQTDMHLEKCYLDLNRLEESMKGLLNPTGFFSPNPMSSDLMSRFREVIDEITQKSYSVVCKVALIAFRDFVFGEFDKVVIQPMADPGEKIEDFTIEKLLVYLIEEKDYKYMVMNLNDRFSADLRIENANFKLNSLTLTVKSNKDVNILVGNIYVFGIFGRYPSSFYLKQYPALQSYLDYIEQGETFWTISLEEPFLNFIDYESFSFDWRQNQLAEEIKTILRVKSEVDQEDNSKHPNLFINKLLKISQEVKERGAEFLDSRFRKTFLTWENFPALVINRHISRDKPELSSRHQLLASNNVLITVSSHTNIFPKKSFPNKSYATLPLFIFASLSQNSSIKDPDFEIRVTMDERSHLTITFDSNYKEDLIHVKEDTLVIKLKSPRVFSLLVVFLSHFPNSRLTDLVFLKKTIEGVCKKLTKERNLKFLEARDSRLLTTEGYLLFLRE